MKQPDFQFIKCAQYYIWWLLNCSESVSNKQISKEVDQLVLRLENISLRTKEYISELDTLKEIISWDYDVVSYKTFQEMNEQFEREYQEEYQRQYQEEYQRQYQEEYQRKYQEEYQRKYQEEYQRQYRERY